jgi:hypothetical protein
VLAGYLAKQLRPWQRPTPGSGRSLDKTTPALVIPKPGLSARNLLAADGETADSSRENPRFGMTILGDYQIPAWRDAALAFMFFAGCSTLPVSPIPITS